jgi:hypothetical protein
VGADYLAHSFSELVEGLEPPTLRGDRGTAYETVHPRPSSAPGSGRMPDGDRRQLVTGAWIYTPAAPADAAALFAQLAAGRWTLTAAR